MLFYYIKLEMTCLGEGQPKIEIEGARRGQGTKGIGIRSLAEAWKLHWLPSWEFEKRKRSCGSIYGGQWRALSACTVSVSAQREGRQVWGQGQENYEILEWPRGMRGR